MLGYVVWALAEPTARSHNSTVPLKTPARRTRICAFRLSESLQLADGC